MYAPRFGLAREPFSIAPDPRFLFMSERHREALAHLLYGLQGGGGFVLLTGEVGAGKTTVCRCFLEQMPAHNNVAYIFNPRLTVTELLCSVCDEFRIGGLPAPAQATVKDCLDPLNAFLLRAHAEGRNNVLIIDEAQNLSAELLEQLRLLTNLETNERKLLQIILIGQPELRTMLEQPALAPLAQRVIARYHLDALSEPETEAYIRHRLAVAGLAGALPFDAGALRRIHRLSGGVPRRINLLADRALLGAWSHDRAQVDRRIVDQAAREVFGDSAPAGRGATRASVLAAGAAALVIGAALWSGAAHWPPTGRGSAATPGPGAASQAVGGGAASAPSARPATGFGTPVALATLLPAADAEPAAAWRALAARWADVPAVDDPCAAGAPLRCHRSAAMTLAQIRQLDRPGLVTLDDGDGRTRPLLLVGLGRDSALLQAPGGAARAVALDDLAQHWHGDFATLWRMPPDAPATADAEAVAAWVAARLGGVVPAASSAASGLATPDAAALRQRIAAFQRAQGLPPDGRVGPLTLMQLNRAAGLDEPRLIQEP